MRAPRNVLIWLMQDINLIPIWLTGFQFYAQDKNVIVDTQRERIRRKREREEMEKLRRLIPMGAKPRTTVELMQ